MVVVGRTLFVFFLLATAAESHAVCGTGDSIRGTDPASLQRASAVLESNGIAADTEYRVVRLVRYESGAGMIWVMRLHRGLPVFRDELALHFDTRGRIKRDKAGKPLLGGEADGRSPPVVDPRPRVDSGAAKKQFAERAMVVHLTDPMGRPGGTITGPDYRERLDELETELGIYEGKLAWKICPRDRAYPYGFISADDGGVIFFDSGVRS